MRNTMLFTIIFIKNNKQERESNRSNIKSPKLQSTLEYCNFEHYIR